MGLAQVVGRLCFCFCFFLMLVQYKHCFSDICGVLEAQVTCMITCGNHVSGLVALLVLALLC